MSEMARVDPVDPIDVAVAVSARAVGVASAATRLAGSVLRPVAGSMLRPRGVPGRLQPGRWLAAVSREGEARRVTLRLDLSRMLDALVPVVLDEALRRAHLTDLVLRHLDLDRAVAAVDLDAAAERLDVSRVIDRIDLTAVVLEGVDLDALILAILDRIDLTSLVLRRVDLDVLIQAVLDRVDLTSVVLRRVDLDVLVQAVLEHVDLVPLAAEVIEGVDLPEIIRESTGSMASETVQGVRMQGIVADEAVGRAVDRLLLRRARRSTRAPTAPGELPSGRASGPARSDRAH